MSLEEIAYRLRKTAFILIQRLGLLTAEKVPAAKSSRLANSFIKKPKHVKTACYLQAADKILEGYLPVFALQDNEFSPYSDWNLDPLTGRQAPLMFGKTLNYRDEALVGDIKYLWEPNRHLHLVTLAQAYHLSKERRYIDGLAVQIDSWLDQCPYLQGPNWTSSLELAIRLINWSLIWQLIGEEQSPLFEGEIGTKRLNRFINSVYQHAHFIQGHYSRYSSANNHLIGEAAGLYIATTTWPYWRQCESWRQTAQNVLEKEALLQNAPDGVNREQAISYQQFVLDFLILAGLAGKASSSEFSAGYWQRIEAMIEFLASIMDVAGNVPMIGDADDGYVVRLSREDNWCPYKSLLATGAVLFNRSDFKAKAGSLDDKTRWIFGDGIEPLFEKLESKKIVLPVRRAFTDGGYYILGSELETSKEIRIVVDAGPLGYESIAAHGHADALAFTLNVGGSEFLIDPGTYAYHTQKKWRDYFRGTPAHNTLCIDDQDQSVSGGNFMWLKKAEAWCEHWEPGEDTDRFIGVHNGYSRLADPLTHRREIILSKAERKIIVEDMILCNGKHIVKGYWHFSEACSVELSDIGIEVVNFNKTIVLGYVGGDASYEIAKGDSERPAGWISRRFDVKEAAPTVIWESVVDGNTTFITEIHCH
ncbi:MAG: alginate lyase family protein [Gammaproteobacteria bacterium]|nr:MAG: alginate lyase family protein [Gammaproteobacteria bacterium]